VERAEVESWLDLPGSSAAELLPRPGRDPFVPTHVVAERAPNGELLRRFDVMALGEDVAYPQEVWSAGGGLGTAYVALRTEDAVAASSGAPFVVEVRPPRYVGTIGSDGVARVVATSANGAELVMPDDAALDWTTATGRDALAAEFVSDVGSPNPSRVEESVRCLSAETRVAWLGTGERVASATVSGQNPSLAWEVGADELTRWLSEPTAAPSSVYPSPVVDRSELALQPNVAATEAHAEVADVMDMAL
jgi:hypothetical protein